ncbi:helix-turn-helix domain-containing protein [Chryseobacterium sp.]|jgi:hypothetical protein|uniref:helix-turn-helix domain-containing protein n=1 Tax=Chryseobacterium sp. TaxID=1871047 RepID=UPI00283BBDED|nr:helix-turn-helix domain-containing protein [Chryseobacterium sp.]MDR3023077.1 helix-turn-helix domain-containing protein [Chryseobacterium sp.]
MSRQSPDYKRIYNDIILKRFPTKERECKTLLSKKNLSMFDIIKLNEIIFGKTNKEALVYNQKYKSYNKQAILEILDFQKKNKLNNSQTANHYNLSRNSIAKWKKIFLV